MESLVIPSLGMTMINSIETLLKPDCLNVEKMEIFTKILLIFREMYTNLLKRKEDGDIEPLYIKVD
jgi:hypothetical protein